MAAVDDLTELVERAAAAERAALAAKRKDRADVEATIRRVRKAAEEQRAAVRLDQNPDRLSPRWAQLRQNYLDLGAQPPVTGEDDTTVTHAAAARAEADAVAAVGVARIALTDAALAVLQARLARIEAGEDAADAAAIDGHVPLAGRNPVSRHGPALAGGLAGEIRYIIARSPGRR